MGPEPGPEARRRDSAGISLDAATAEERLRLEPADRLTPETVFERQWAAAVLARCLERLRREEEAAGGGDRFDRLKAFLCGDGARSGYAALARELVDRASPRCAWPCTGSAGASARCCGRRWRETLTDPAEVDSEIRWLLTAVRGDA